MDANTFDDVIKRLARSLDRRKMIKGSAVAGALAAVGTPLAAVAEVSIEACRANGKRCKRHGPRSCRRCCSNKGALDVYFVRDAAGKKRCACRPAGNVGCTNDSQCCSGVCDETTNICG